MPCALVGLAGRFRSQEGTIFALREHPSGRATSSRRRSRLVRHSIHTDELSPELAFMALANINLVELSPVSSRARPLFGLGTRSTGRTTTSRRCGEKHIGAAVVVVIADALDAPFGTDDAKQLRRQELESIQLSRGSRMSKSTLVPSELNSKRLS
jgi:hypothetical protein